jgi:hypothetical protein
MDDAITVIAGIEIPSTDPAFLTVVGIHILLGLAGVVTGAIAMLSEKRAGRHPRNGTIYFWCLAGVFLTAASLAAVRWATTCSSSEPCRLRRLISAGRPGGGAGTIGSGCTLPGWDRPTCYC